VAKDEYAKGMSTFLCFVAGECNFKLCETSLNCVRLV